MKFYELAAVNGRKSFNGKAKVVITGNKRTLFSYGTPIVTIDESDGTYLRHWNGWTVTTGTHINAFLNREKMTKKDFEFLVYEPYA